MHLQNKQTSKQTTNFIFITSDVPEATEPPTISDVTATSMTVNWSPPKSDGGSPITGYYVEKKDKFGTRFSRVNAEPVKGTSFNVTGLTQGDEYVFRIVAENKAGPGKPSGQSVAKVAKPPYGK